MNNETLKTTQKHENTKGANIVKKEETKRVFNITQIDFDEKISIIVDEKGEEYQAPLRAQNRQLKSGEDIFAIDLKGLNIDKRYISVNTSTKLPLSFDNSKNRKSRVNKVKIEVLTLQNFDNYLDENEKKTFTKLFEKATKNFNKELENKKREEEKRKIESVKKQLDSLNLTPEQLKQLLSK